MFDPYPSDNCVEDPAEGPVHCTFSTKEIDIVQILIAKLENQQTKSRPFDIYLTMKSQWPKFATLWLCDAGVFSTT